ncbi:MAG: SMC-Scp complex subunit ScpB [Gammaproteobacteria bacterium]|nr:SMC-Scp complex subunit ScpB [Gammaproteobacteria bacterium]
MNGSETTAVSVLEAILFVAEEPVPIAELAEVLEMSTERVQSELEKLATELDDRGSGLIVRTVGGGWRLYARSGVRAYLDRYATTATATRLSPAALEVLSIVAYKQPVSRGQIAEIRGVDSGSAVRTLERRGLIEELERLSVPGNPAVYGTSALFLEKLGIGSLNDLPPLADHVPPSRVVESLEETFRTDL